jgi:hypothetical protein
VNAANFDLLKTGEDFMRQGLRKRRIIGSMKTGAR